MRSTMCVADGYDIKIHIKKPRILLTLVKGNSNVAQIILEKDEAERMISGLKRAMSAIDAPPRRKKHFWERING